MSLAKYSEKITDSGVEMNSYRDHSEFIIHHILLDLGTDSGINNVQLSKNNILSDITTFTLDGLFTECESAYEYYDSFILKTDNEEIMNKALFLASETLTQLNLLQEIKNKIADR
jgi:hypothetical protein